jgi:hypothetical protein
MDTTLLTQSRQPLDPQYEDKLQAQLRRRGYTENEVGEIHRRAMAWLEDELEPHPVLGKIVPLRREYKLAIAEVLSDSADIALGRYA